MIAFASCTGAGVAALASDGGTADCGAADWGALELGLIDGSVDVVCASAGVAIARALAATKRAFIFHLQAY